MKRLTSSLTLLCFLILPPAYSADIVVALSPWNQADTTKAQAKTVLQFLTQLEPGHTVILMDGYRLSTIGEFTIPENPAYRGAKARLAVNRKAVAALFKFAGHATPPGAPGQPTVVGALRLPQLLHHIAENIATGDTLDVMLLGSPLYDDPKESAFSMAQGAFPSDGHLFAGRDKTPFGASDNAELFKTLRVHIGYDAESGFRDDRHRHFVKRFWTLYTERLGGKLVTFTGDLPSVLRGVQNHAEPLAHQYEPVQTDKLEMIRIVPAKVKKSVFERDLTDAPLPASSLRRAKNVEIGISWDCQSCDLDLYARPFPGTQLLYYAKPTSREGQYWKDHKRSPRPTGGYEIIAFSVPLDLQALKIAVNFYNGNAPHGVDGELRLSVDGRTYARNFHIKAKGGNSGRDINQAINDSKNTAHSLAIDPLLLIAK